MKNHLLFTLVPILLFAAIVGARQHDARYTGAYDGGYIVDPPQNMNIALPEWTKSYTVVGLHDRNGKDNGQTIHICGKHIQELERYRAYYEVTFTLRKDATLVAPAKGPLPQALYCRELLNVSGTRTASYS